MLAGARSGDQALFIQLLLDERINGILTPAPVLDLGDQLKHGSLKGQPATILLGDNLGVGGRGRPHDNAQQTNGDQRRTVALAFATSFTSDQMHFTNLAQR